MGRARLHEIPEIPIEIFEHSDRSIRRDRWLAHELDADFDHPSIISPEVIGVEKEADATAGLVSHKDVLARIGGTRQKKTGAG
jgi:hypothetical protein